ncbi:hypothetical protein GALMADRAFT_210654 [Galerina marginata CBS 339.88]|uniref:Uncharacterized protein n=1 Tax=Galerina marginata (strain CBS 339.88) TaxID=685588 RepID=A0A067TA67_GALM3|nr:hypothetical protein GALMADRAFT_210654 [Galerina marginata CBS 339.88]
MPKHVRRTVWKAEETTVRNKSAKKENKKAKPAERVIKTDGSGDKASDCSDQKKQVTYPAYTTSKGDEDDEDLMTEMEENWEQKRLNEDGKGAHEGKKSLKNKKRDRKEKGEYKIRQERTNCRTKKGKTQRGEQRGQLAAEEAAAEGDLDGSGVETMHHEGRVRC